MVYGIKSIQDCRHGILTSVQESRVLPGLFHKSGETKFWPVVHHLALEHVERVVDDVRNPRRRCTHGKITYAHRFQWSPHSPERLTGAGLSALF